MVSAGAPARSDGRTMRSRDADIVITMLPAGQHVRERLSRANGLLTAAQEGALLIDSSTIDIDSARAVHAAAEKAGFDFLDAPVSGGVGGAEAGTLTFMCGGSEASLSSAPSRSWRKWASAWCLPAAPARARRRRSATTCCSRSP